MFGLPKANVQRTINYVMTGTMEALKREYIPSSKEDIDLVTKFKCFKQAVGAVDTTLIPIQHPSNSELRCKWFPGKYHIHSGKIQVLASSNGRPMRVSQLIPGRRHDSYLFRISGSAEFIKTTTMEHGKRETRHPYILGDSGYIGLQDIYPELIVGEKNLRMKKRKEKN